MFTNSSVPRALAAVVLSGALIVGCGEQNDAATDTDADSNAGSEQSTALTIEDAFVKSADEGMTAAFGTLVNTGEEEVTVVSAESDITSDMELHETVDGGEGMTMQEKDGGFVVPAGESHVLEPGGDHIMVMDLARPIAPGEDVTFILNLSDGSSVEVVMPVRDIAGGDEPYMGDMGDDMEMDDPEASETS